MADTLKKDKIPFPVEPLQRIGANILQRIKEERELPASEFAVTRIAIILGGKHKIVWLFNTDSDGKSWLSWHRGSLGKDVVTSKHSPFASLLLKNRFSPFSVKDEEVFVKEITSYRVSFLSGTPDAINGIFEFPDFPHIPFRGLRQFLRSLPAEEQEAKRQADLKRLQEEKLSKAEYEARVIALEQQQQQQEERLLLDLESTERYIRETNALRMAPVLDAEQSKVKDALVMDGMLIIDGGPGTGKTTTLIQRINFLTQKKAVSEYKKLSSAVMEELDGEKGWLFLSPSELLKVYLQNAMSEEGLKAGSTKVKVWESYLGEVFRRYQLFQTGNKKPVFTKLRGMEAALFPNNWSFVEGFLQSFDKHILDTIKKTANQPFTKLEDTKLNNFRQRFSRSLEELTKVKEWIGTYRLMLTLREEYSAELNEYSKELNVLLQRAVAETRIGMEDQAPELYEEIAEWITKNVADVVEDEEEEEDEEENEAELSLDQQTAIVRKLRGWVRNHAMLSLKRGVSIPPAQRSWIGKIAPYIPSQNLQRIGELSLLVKEYRKWAAGPDGLLLGKMHRYYRNFRSAVIDGQLPALNQLSTSFKRITESGKDKIHYEEMNVLLYWLNSKVKSIFQRFPELAKNSGQRYIQGYEQCRRHHVVVDEASDFSLVELLAMQSFTHLQNPSFTLCGDLMQRMNSKGIQNWDVVMEAMRPMKSEVHELRTSYRQSPTLLKIATRFYQKTTGREAHYIARAAVSSLEPKPWIAHLETPETLAAWLADKITEIHGKYGGRTPSIAIFCPTDEQVDLLTKLLKDSDVLYNLDIGVSGVKSDGAFVDAAKVCVYNIASIKGLEFEAAFFIDVDCIDYTDEELLAKYLYVGLSRAAYYLGITYKNTLPPSLEFLKDDTDGI